jgi:hypothetical protein
MGELKGDGKRKKIESLVILFVDDHYIYLF